MSTVVVVTLGALACGLLAACMVLVSERREAS